MEWVPYLLSNCRVDNRNNIYTNKRLQIQIEMQVVIIYPQTKPMLIETNISYQYVDFLEWSKYLYSQVFLTIFSNNVNDYRLKLVKNISLVSKQLWKLKSDANWGLFLTQRFDLTICWSFLAMYAAKYISKWWTSLNIWRYNGRSRYSHLWLIWTILTWNTNYIFR